MKAYLKNWDIIRVLRLSLGIIILMQGIAGGDWLFIAIGGWFSLMPILNIGCCGTSGCSMPVSKGIRNTEDAKLETYLEYKS